MPIQLSCSCGKKLRVPDEAAGKKIRCPVCQAVVPVSAGNGVPPPPKPIMKVVRPPAAEEEETPLPSKPGKKAVAVAALARKAVRPPDEEEDEAPATTPTSELLTHNKFVVQEKGKLLSRKKTYEITDETGEPLAIAREKAGWFATLMGTIRGRDHMSLTVEVRDQGDDTLIFSVRRRSLIFKKIQVLNGEGEVIGSYKAKLFSFTGGFNIYDHKRKHFARVNGKWFSDNFSFVSPDGKTQMGSVSRKWGGLAKELFTSDTTYGVAIEAEYQDDADAKILLLGAAIALNAMFKQHGGGVAAGGGEGGE